MLAFVGFHDEERQFLQSQGELEKLNVFQIVIVKENISEGMSHFHLFFVDNSCSYLDQSFL
jgi:hypothetical protein